MITNQGSETMQQMGERRFEFLNTVVIPQEIDRIVKLDAKAPFELSIFGPANVVLHTCTVKQHDGDWNWNRGNLREELKNQNHGIVRVYFEDANNRSFENTISLDEVRDATGSGAPPQTRKHTAGASAD